jgi:hypothetical protein
MDGGAVAGSWIQVDKQIEWIAKGLVPLGQNMNDWAGFKKLVHELAEANLLNEVLMQEIEDEADTRIQFAFQDRHEQEVNNYFTPNNYDKAFLPGFVMDDIGYFNYVWVPDANTVDTTLPHVVCPYRTSEAWNDSTTGYYWDAGGQIDSLMIHWEDDPTEDYYIWVVLYEPPVTADDPLDPERDGYCGDGVCDLSSEDETCEDCDPVQQPGGNISYAYKVILESIEVYNDEKQYFESWLMNRYDLAFVGCIFKDNNILDAVGHAFCDNYYRVSGTNITSHKIDRDNVCCVNGSKTYHCPSSQQFVNKVIANDFIVGDTLMLLGYERDVNILTSKHKYFMVGDPVLGIHFWMLVRRNDKAVNPYYLANNNEYRCLAATDSIDICTWNHSQGITTSSFTGANSSTIIDNGEWRYTLKLEVKQ